MKKQLVKRQRDSCSELPPNKSLKVLVSDTTSSPSTTTSTIDRWAMIELNGQLLAPTIYDPQTKTSQLKKRNGIELGLLSFDSNQSPQIVVGTHEIKGKVVSLKRPFLVMRKGDKEAENSPIVIEGIIEEKFLFDSYPKTIMRAINTT